MVQGISADRFGFLALLPSAADACPGELARQAVGPILGKVGGVEVCHARVAHSLGHRLQGAQAFLPTLEGLAVQLKPDPHQFAQTALVALGLLLELPPCTVAHQSPLDVHGLILGFHLATDTRAGSPLWPAVNQPLAVVQLFDRHGVTAG
ncbi:hypothetical protein D3C81_1709600 [compost metagenome]